MSNININFQCTLAYLNNSLKNICQTFKVPKDLSKDDFDIMQMNEHNIEDPILKE